MNAAPPNLLLVDADPRSLQMLEVSLRKAGYRVATCTSGAQAQESIAGAAPDMVLTDVCLPDMDGFTLLQWLKGDAGQPDTPVLFISSDGSLETKVRGLELGAKDFLTKPIYIKEVITRINLEFERRAREGLAQKGQGGKTHFSGDLTEMPVVDLLQTLEVGRKAGVARFRSARGVGQLVFRGGSVIHARLGLLEGEPAVCRVLLWNEGHFEIDFCDVSDVVETVQTPIQGLLMEGMRRLDEWSRLAATLPPLDHIVAVNAEALAAQLAQIPDALNGVLRLADGQRSLIQLVDACLEDDLETLQALRQLHMDGILRDTGYRPAQQPDEREHSDPDWEAMQPLAPLLTGPSSRPPAAPEASSLPPDYQRLEPSGPHAINQLRGAPPAGDMRFDSYDSLPQDTLGLGIADSVPPAAGLPSAEAPAGERRRVTERPGASFDDLGPIPGLTLGQQRARRVVWVSLLVFALCGGGYLAYVKLWLPQPSPLVTRGERPSTRDAVPLADAQPGANVAVQDEGAEELPHQPAPPAPAAETAQEVATPEADLEPFPEAALVAAEKSLSRGRVKAAEKAFSELAVHPAAPAAVRSGWAMALLQRSRAEAAAFQATQAISRDATDSRGWIVLGAARQSLGQREAAFEAYGACVERGQGEFVKECKRMMR